MKKVYNSEFYLINHFDYETTKEWLTDEGFNEKDIELTWKYLGECSFDIITLLLNRRNLKERFNLTHV